MKDDFENRLRKAFDKRPESAIGVIVGIRSRREFVGLQFTLPDGSKTDVKAFSYKENNGNPSAAIEEIIEKLQEANKKEELKFTLARPKAKTESLYTEQMNQILFEQDLESYKDAFSDKLSKGAESYRVDISIAGRKTVVGVNFYDGNGEVISRDTRNSTFSKEELMKGIREIADKTNLKNANSRSSSFRILTDERNRTLGV